MPRLIDDKRRKHAICVLIIMASIMTISVYIWHKFSAINEQRRSEGQNVLDSLAEKRSWLAQRIESPLHDADDLEKQISKINKLLNNKDNIIKSNNDLILITNKKAENVKEQCKEILSELSKVKKRLSELSNDGSQMRPLIRNIAKKQDIIDIKKLYVDVDNSYSRLNQICNQHYIFYPTLQRNMKGCMELIEQINTCQINNSNLQQLVRMHEDYIAWKQSVEKQFNRYNFLYNKLQESYQKFISFPLDREKIQEESQKQFNAERIIIESLIVTGTNLCNNSLTQLNEELSKLHSTAQNAINLITELENQHGMYIDDTNVKTASQKYETFKELRQTSEKNVKAQCIIIRKSIENLKLSLHKISDAIKDLMNFDNVISDKIVLQKYNDYKEHMYEMQSIRDELKKNLETLKKYITQVKSSANKTINEITRLANILQHSFHDWTSEGRKIAKDINDIIHETKRIRIKINAFQKECIEYSLSNNHELLELLREKSNYIIEILDNIENKYTFEQSCSNGKELNKLKQKRDEMKRMHENASQNAYALFSELENAFNTGKLRKIQYIPYSKSLSIASQLQDGKRHFYLAIDIPSEGKHKIVIHFKKDRRSLYYTRSDLRKHQIIANCIISGIQYKIVPTWSWTDSQIPWSKEVVLVGDFPQGKIDINLDLTFKAVVGTGIPINNGVWQFQYDMPNSNLKQDNFSIEVMLDDTPKEILIRQ